MFIMHNQRNISIFVHIFYYWFSREENAMVRAGISKAIELSELRKELLAWLG